jgi:hypothetical protein
VRDIHLEVDAFIVARRHREGEAMDRLLRLGLKARPLTSKQAAPAGQLSLPPLPPWPGSVRPELPRPDGAIKPTSPVAASRAMAKVKNCWSQLTVPRTNSAS